MNLKTTIDNFDFCLLGSVIIVFRDQWQINAFTALDNNGLPRIGCQEDLDNEAMWWLRDNGVL